MEHIKKLLQRVCKKRERKARKGAEKNRQGDTCRKNEARKMEPSNISEILLSAQTNAATERARKSCESFARLEASRKAAIETIDYDAEREEAMNEKFGIID